MTERPEWIYPTAFATWDDREYEAMDRVMRSGRLTMGDEVAQFESEFAAWHGVKHCVMTNSGSSANLIMVAALFHLGDNGRRLRYGDVAYVPAIAWSTTYAPFMQRDVRISLLDVDNTWCARPEIVHGHIQPGSVIVGCSILGNPTYAAQWRKIAFDAGAVYVEDNCESFGAVSPEGDRCGTLGLMNTFSFFYSHQISAVEGGAVLTDDDECDRLLRQLRAHGWTRDTCNVHLKDFHEEYDFRLPGYNVRPTEMYAAVARVQLAKSKEHAQLRHANLKYFWDEVQRRHVRVTLPHLRGVPSTFGLHFEVRGERRAAVAELLRERGVDCRLPTGGSFHKHEYGAVELWQPTPRADTIHKCGMFIGNGPIDLREKIDLALIAIDEATR